MALSEADVLDIVKRYDRGDGDSVPALAQAFEVSDQTIRYHLKKRGVYGSDVPAMETDKDLGIGEEHVSAADSNATLAAIIASPQFSAILEQAVQAKIAAMGIGAAPGIPTQGDGFGAVIEAMKHMLEVQAMQQPGYIKPLPAEEVDRRAAGYIDMKALLRKFEAEGLAPMYTVGDGGFFECTNAQEFGPGQKIRTYLPPVESFIPENEAAKKVHAAMMVWIGGKTPDIGEQLEAAQRESHLPPLVTGAMQGVAKSGRVELVDAPRADVSRKRVAGTVVPERRNITPGMEPQGPIFVGADAVAA